MAGGLMAANEPKLTGADLSHLRVSPKTLVEEVIQKLRMAIFSGLLKPGDRLIESELCVSLGVSRPALREAIRCLQAERLCDITPHRGAQIPVLSWQDAQDIYHVRELLEGEAAALCAVNISEEGILSMQNALKQFSDAVNSFEAYVRVEATSLFYSILLKNAKNRVIEEIILGLLARINFLRSRSMSLPERARHSLREMEAIYLAIKDRNPEAARAAAIAHVAQAREAARNAYILANLT
ncbi:GntR family transcriptional regulator [Xanthobacter sp. DSM 24535]|uniref:GntR family transcriptional regulator n=1 Tax=Roseixanthobacter psychrophilus TaxID=3119917 RepID=UPI00372B75B5